MSNQKVVMSMKDIVKTYFIGQENELEILHGIDLDIYEGEFVAIVGESGSGKSTLMNIMGILDQPTSGTYYLNGLDVSKGSDDKLAYIRNQEVGFVFQNYYLISRMSALKNVELPLLYAGVDEKTRKARAMELLKMVGMEDRMDHFPNELSGGQKQRVAIARAMANHPSILLADEPTGALDSKTSQEVMDLFENLHKNQHLTLVLITHNPKLAKRAQRIVTLKDGEIEKIEEGVEE